MPRPASARFDKALVMVHRRIMITVDINEVQARFSSFIEMAESGETIVVCKLGQPVVRIEPIPATLAQAPVLGSAKGQGRVLASFHEPIDDSELALWEGRSEVNGR